MAMILKKLVTPVLRIAPVVRPGQPIIRTRVTTPTGAILPSPTVMRFGIPAVCIFISPFIYFGATISKEGAAFLEENDIFVPDDDD